MWTILLVDDLKFILDQQAGVLAREEIRVFMATGFDDTVALARANPPDLILLDYRIEQSRAEELWQTLSNLPEVIDPVIIVTLTRGLDEKAKDSLPSWVDGVLWKPFDENGLLDSITTHLAIPLRKGIRASSLIECRTGRAGEEFTYARIQNISTSGVLIEASTRLDMEGLYECHFALPSEMDVLSLTIEVVREVPPTGASASGHRYGAKFVECPSQVSQRIAAFVEDHLRAKRSARTSEVSCSSIH